MSYLSHAHELLLLLVLLRAVQGLVRETLSLHSLALSLWCGVLVQLLLLEDVTHAACEKCSQVMNKLLGEEIAVWTCGSRNL